MIVGAMAWLYLPQEEGAFRVYSSGAHPFRVEPLPKHRRKTLRLLSHARHAKIYALRIF